jgi:hypothetical protein
MEENDCGLTESTIPTFAMDHGKLRKTSVRTVSAPAETETSHLPHTSPFHLSKSLVESRSCEADSHSASSEINNFLWDPKIHLHVHNSPSFYPILGQTNPIFSHPASLKNHLKIILQECFDFTSNLFSSGIPTKILHEFFTSPMCYISLHLTLLDLILIIFHKSTNDEVSYCAIFFHLFLLHFPR